MKSDKNVKIKLSLLALFLFCGLIINIQIGLISNLKGKEPNERLERSGNFIAMVSHRVRLTEVAQVDEELIGWLKEAYEQA